MKLSALKLLQPTVFAIIYFLLIVMQIGQGWCSRKVVVLYHDRSHNYVTMIKNKTAIRVTTMPVPDKKFTPYQCFEMESIKMDNHIGVVIYNHAVRKFLCSNRKGDLKFKAKCTPMCYFKEEFAELGLGTLQYISMCSRKNFTLAFTSWGEPKKGVKNKPSSFFLKQENTSCVLQEKKRRPPMDPIRHNNSKKCPNNKRP